MVIQQRTLCLKTSLTLVGEWTILRLIIHDNFKVLIKVTAQPKTFTWTRRWRAMMISVSNRWSQTQTSLSRWARFLSSSPELFSSGIVWLVSARRSGEWFRRGDQLTGFILTNNYTQRGVLVDNFQGQPSLDDLMDLDPMAPLQVSPWIHSHPPLKYSTVDMIKTLEKNNPSVLQAGQPNHMVFWISMELAFHKEFADKSLTNKSVP